ncbi:MAG: energy transducer TonB [Spirochaetes bacterium]|nr:energy transducer TonB [Spirochaetota bacterium]
MAIKVKRKNLTSIVMNIFIVIFFSGACTTNTQTAIKSENETFIIVEEMPEFPGGNHALRQWIADNITYPAEALEKSIGGRVYISFAVESDGNITDVRVVRGVFPSLDQEALRVIKLLPKWKPGKQRGRSVKVLYVVPVNFKIQ